MDLSLRMWSVVLVLFAVLIRCNCIQGVLFNRRLEARTFRTIFGVSVQECSKQCLGRLRCLSVSYIRKMRMCNLHADDSNTHTLLVESGYVYLEKANMDTGQGMPITWGNPVDDLYDIPLFDGFNPSPSIMPYQCSPPCSPEEACELQHGTPTCDMQECSSPPSITSTQVLGNRRHVGSKILYACKDGFMLNPSLLHPVRMSTCQQNGSWTAITIVCQSSAVDCGMAPLLTNGNVVQMGSSLGAVATYSCNSGYAMTSGSAHRTCGGTGAWSGSDVVCTIMCPALTSPANGHVTYTGLIDGDTASYTCNAGYSGPTPGTRSCTSTGSWNGAEVICTAVDCGTLTSSVSATVQFLGGTSFGATATYTCISGYSMTSGSTQRTCDASGQWSGTAAVCELGCGSPPTHPNTQVSNTGGTLVGATATYTCDVGYVLASGNTPMTCDASGAWVGTAVVCTIISCPSLSNPANGLVMTSGLTYGSIATYTCISGYSPTPAATRTCSPTGSWNGTNVACSIDCGPPSQNDFTNVVAPTTTLGSTASYSCYDGYIFRYGGTVRTCQSWGWDGWAMTCGMYDPPCNNASVISGSMINVAASKPVQMSSQFNEHALPGYLVDGVRGTNGPFASTNHNVNPWMQVNLQANYAIKAVRVVNRSDCCTSGLTNVRIYLGDGSTMTHLAAGHDAVIQTQCLFELDPPVTASHVRIQVLLSGYLTVDEMQVYVDP